jgi:hypothetical protein
VQWKEQYEGSSTGRFYRQIEPEPEFTTKIDKLKLARYLSGSPRRVLSKIVQLRSGHARLRQHYVGGCAPPEVPLCECGEALTIAHILLECALLEDATEKLEVEPR